MGEGKLNIHTDKNYVYPKPVCDNETKYYHLYVYLESDDGTNRLVQNKRKMIFELLFNPHESRYFCKIDNVRLDESCGGQTLQCWNNFRTRRPRAPREALSRGNCLKKLAQPIQRFLTLRLLKIKDSPSNLIKPIIIWLVHLGKVDTSSSGIPSSSNLWIRPVTFFTGITSVVFSSERRDLASSNAVRRQRWSLPSGSQQSRRGSQGRS